MRARYLAGCDGARGVVRAGIGVEFASETIDPHPMITADVVVEGLERTHWHMWDNAKGGALWLGPLVQTNAFQLYAKFEDAEPDLSFEALRKLVRERTGRPELNVTEVLYASHFGSRAGLAKSFRAGRAFLVGDAAHVHPPAGGQGMNTAVQDAYNLGWKLGHVLRHGAPPALLDSYEEERLPVAAHLLEFVVQMHKDWLGKAKDKEEPRKGEHMQLGLNYRGGPLSLDERGAVGEGVTRAGDRAPDARLTRCGRRAGAAVRPVPRPAFHAAGAGRRGAAARSARNMATRSACIASSRPGAAGAGRADRRRRSGASHLRRWADPGPARRLSRLHRARRRRGPAVLSRPVLRLIGVRCGLVSRHAHAAIPRAIWKRATQASNVRPSRKWENCI